MAGSTPDTTNMFQFMVVRPPGSIEPSVARRRYIKDHDDLFSDTSASTVGPMVYKKVFCDDAVISMTNLVQDSDPSRAQAVVAALLEGLSFFEPDCPSPVAGELEALGHRSYVLVGGRYYVMPDRLEDVGAPLHLGRVLQFLESPPLLPDGALDSQALVGFFLELFDDRPLKEVVFASGAYKGVAYSEKFATARRLLFDTLYTLYILRRITSINLEHIIQGLRALHVLEALAVSRSPIAELEDLHAYLAATPVIHPLFARLRRFRSPFNPLRPIGVGDLKVVKQSLCGYKAGDFAHVDNVLDGETKVRAHRRLEKTEELLSFGGEKQEETQRDTQSTDRFELKREAESVIKQDLAINVNATVTYNGVPVVATATAGMSYTRSQTDQNKAADNFSHDVVDKAVKRIQSRVSEQRSTTKHFETEETNTHTLSSPAGHGHISGIYRWLDKEYKAQLYNYGKRMMFEFVLPEPAAFLVEARLRAYETQIEVPKPPPAKPPHKAHLDYAPEAIDLNMFRDLRGLYDLADLSYPVLDKVVAFKEEKTGNAYFRGANTLSQEWVPTSFSCDLHGDGYDITGLLIDGTMDFKSTGPVAPGEQDPLRQRFAISIDGTQVFFGNYDGRTLHGFHAPNTDSLDTALHAPSFTPYRLGPGPVDLVLSVHNAVHFTLEISARMKFRADALLDWQYKVYDRVLKLEQARLDALDQHIAQAYQAQLATYHNRLAELHSTAVNELLQGQSDALNRQLIANELKRQCLAMLTFEFDAYRPDDRLTDLDAMGARDVQFEYRQLEVTEHNSSSDPETVESVDASFSSLRKDVQYPVPSLPPTAAKGRYIQFLEQAFDWQQLAYTFYPYFWAVPAKWIDLMSRSDHADPNMSAFLQAGSCKVLLAAAPAYDDAVLHFLATGEPWEGGPAPVIGDPLYVPLYEELRKQQDDLTGAKAEGKSWKFTVPTSLVYLENSSTKLPASVCDP